MVGHERFCDSTRARGCIVGWRGSFPFEPRALGFQLETAAVWLGRHEWREGHARQFREDTADLRHAIGCGRASPCGLAVLSLELERRELAPRASDRARIGSLVPRERWISPLLGTAFSSAGTLMRR